MRVIQCTAAVIALAVAAGGLTGCAIERAQVAHDAQSRMVGLTKKNRCSCAWGVPAAKAAEGATEVWCYNSGNDHTQTAIFGQSKTNASLYGSRQFATGNPYTASSGFGIASRDAFATNC